MINGKYLAFEFPLISNEEYSKCDSGIKKKIYGQYNTFIAHGYTMSFVNPYEKYRTLNKRLRRRLPLFWLTKWDDQELYEEDSQFEYIRKPWHMDGDLIRHLKKAKHNNPSIKILLEVPTFPYDNEHHSFSMKPLVYKDRFWRQFLKKYVDRIVTYSDDMTIFGIPTIRISNAMDTTNVKPANYKQFDPNNIHIMLCATLSYWHGYDRAIEGLKEYYDRGGKTNFVLHIVGEGEEYANYKTMIEANHLESHVILYGNRYGIELDHIYEQCDVGFDSLGRHRSGVKYNSSLKGKEYAAKGLPIVSGVLTELDFDKSFKYYYRIPADDSLVDYFGIETFCKQVYKGKKVEEVRNDIRNYSDSHFSYEVTFAPIFEYLDK